MRSHFPEKNKYTKAIKKTLDILAYYDTDGYIPVFGFGAKLPPFYNTVSHCFALNGNIFDPDTRGAEGIIEAYQRCIQQL